MRSYIKSNWLDFESEESQDYIINIMIIYNKYIKNNVSIFFDVPVSFALKVSLIIKNRMTPSFCDFIIFHPK